MVSIAATAQRRRKTHNVPIWVHSFSHRLYDKQLTLTPIIIIEEKKKKCPESLNRVVKIGNKKLICNWHFACAMSQRRRRGECKTRFLLLFIFMESEKE